MAMKTKRWSKIPTQSEIENFTGLHCEDIYKECVNTGWRCPCCGRSAKELIRWSEISNEYLRKLYGDSYGMGWTISITRHHCHNEDYQRFETTVICGDCNIADRKAKQGLNKKGIEVPNDFSFSPDEIKQFVTCKPHSGYTEIDYEIAEELYLESFGD